MDTLIIEKLKKEDLKEAIAIYDTNHNSKTNHEKLLQNYDKIYNCKRNTYNVINKCPEKIALYIFDSSTA